MKKLFSLVFLSFFSLSVQVKTQFLTSVSSERYNFKDFNWKHFGNNVQNHIDFRNNFFNAKRSPITKHPKIDKINLFRLELELYKPFLS